MNTALITLGAIILVPVIVLMVLRINAALVFLSLCLGDVLVQFVGADTNSLLSLFSKAGAHSATANNVQLLLLLLPVVLTSIFMIRTVRGGGKLALNFLPAVGVGVLGALLAVPLLPPGTVNNILNSSFWAQMSRLQAMIVGLSAMLCLFVLWLQRPKTGEGKHSKHRG